MSESEPQLQPRLQPRLAMPDHFNLLQWARGWTCASAATWASAVGFLTHCTMAGTSICRNFIYLWTWTFMSCMCGSYVFPFSLESLLMNKISFNVDQIISFLLCFLLYISKEIFLFSEFTKSLCFLLKIYSFKVVFFLLLFHIQALKPFGLDFWVCCEVSSQICFFPYQ